MNNKERLNHFGRKLRLGLASLFWVLVVYASIGEAHAEKKPHLPDRAAHESAKSFEVKYMKQMMDHHLVAVYTASICQQRAMHAELIAMCAGMEAQQRQEIAIMQDWLKSWYGISYSPTLSQADEMKIRMLGSLSGEKFEIRFMTEMIPHHAVAINKSLRCLIRGAHEDLLKLCESIISMQASEILQLRLWLCNWYQRCVLYAETPSAPRPMPPQLSVRSI